MKRRLVVLLLLAATMLPGCWDRMEVEDQLFAIGMGIDAGREKRYRLSLRVPIVSTQEAGILGGNRQRGSTSELIVAEADTVSEGVLLLNAAATRRITLRHLRAIFLGEELCRDSLADLWSELLRHPEVRGTTALLIARGTAWDILTHNRPTSEYNPGKLAEGILLVEKQLHMSPPVRLHHMWNRAGAIGIHPFASVIAVNPRVAGGQSPLESTEGSAVAGEMLREQGNPVEVNGTAVFRDTTLAGFLNTDETQALLALRGEMGKAYISFPNPYRPNTKIMMRFQQENLPKYQARLTPDGPRITVKVLFEGEVLAGRENYFEEAVRRRVEHAARDYMVATMESVLAKLKKWEVDPVGFGLLFRGRFPSWQAWNDFGWAGRVKDMEVAVSADMRIRRFGLRIGSDGVSEED